MKYTKGYYRSPFNQSCFLCGSADNSHHGLCEACHADLPWLISACHHCAEPIPANLGAQPICSRCQHQLPSFDRTYAAFSYSFPISQLIPRIKYQRRPEALGWLSQTFAELLRERIDTPPALLLPVPMRPWRALIRGFNQAELIARALSQQLDIPMRSDLLRKKRPTLRQARLNRASRVTNLAGSFTLRGEIPEHLAVVDDVMTTGSTAEELARVLKRAGAKRVDIWILARTP